MAEVLKVLIVDDNPTDAELMVRALAKAGFNSEWRRVDNERDYAAQLRPELDVILCDYRMPKFSATRALEVLHEKKMDVPFIIVSGAIGEDTAVAVMKQGAADYLLKDRLVRLGPAVALAIDQCRLRREGEQARAAAEKANQIKSEFLANMSHEIRTPMNALIGTLDLLVSDEPSAERRKSLETAKGAALSLLGLLNDILSLSTMDSGKIRRINSAFSLGDCIEVHLHDLKKEAADKGVAMNVRLAPEIPEVLIGDQLLLGRIITKLVGNAVKFTAQGEIDVRVDVKSLTEQEAALMFEVRDTGIGISREHQEMIFSPFVQVNSSSTRTHGGLGLGLAILQRAIQIMGGEIRVESEPGKGSAFFFGLTFGVGMTV